jgi:flagellar motility protein MotE (MotC chaperone)
MKFIILFLFCIIISSCASTTRTTSSGSLTLQATTDSVLKAQAIARSIPECRPVADELDNTKDQILKLQSQVDKNFKERSEMAERLEYLEAKYSQAVGILWKWRLIGIGGMLLLPAFLALRNLFPILKLF